MPAQQGLEPPPGVGDRRGLRLGSRFGHLLRGPVIAASAPAGLRESRPPSESSGCWAPSRWPRSNPTHGCSTIWRPAPSIAAKRRSSKSPRRRAAWSRPASNNSASLPWATGPLPNPPSGKSISRQRSPPAATHRSGFFRYSAAPAHPLPDERFRRQVSRPEVGSGVSEAGEPRQEDALELAMGGVLARLEVRASGDLVVRAGERLRRVRPRKGTDKFCCSFPPSVGVAPRFEGNKHRPIPSPDAEYLLG